MDPSVQKLTSTVKRVRDILRKVGITDMDSMMHCVLFTAARMLDSPTLKKLGLAPPLEWSLLMKKILDKDVDGADTQFKNILTILDAKFGTKGFPYNLTSKDDFVAIAKAFDDVDIHEAAKHTDVLGYIYEQHLSTGAGSGRDLGKFYTDRVITRYLTNLLGVEVSSSGRPDSMCDATMGTGGFILSYIDEVTKNHPNVKWDKYDLAGGDIDDKVAAIARLNVFLKTGIVFPMIRPRNTLKNDIYNTDAPAEHKKFQRLLMNIPFGVKGLKLADDCCQRVKDIMKAGTKSEPLFLALTCQLLAEGGKAAVIVPDGVLVNQSNQHDALRRYLLDNFNLSRIIKMRGKYFMNTGIQPSVLVFENTGKPTVAVEFWDVEKKETGELVETLVLTVPRDMFVDGCSFDMRRYQEVKAVANPAGFPMVKFSEIATFVNGYAFKSEEFKNEGIPVVKITTIKNNIITFEKAEYVNRSPKLSPYIVKEREIVIALSGATLGIVGRNISGVECYLNQRVAKMNITSDKVNPNYVYYYMITSDFIEKLRNLAGGSAQPNVSTKNIEELTFPLPTLETQQEIVATLDRIYAPGTNELAETLKLTDKAMDLVLANPGGASLEPIVEAQRLMRKSAQMVADVKAQMVAIMKSVGHRGFHTGKVGDNISFMNGYAFKSEEFLDYGVPIVKIKNIKSSILSFEKAQYSKQDTKLSKYAVKQSDMVISLTGELSGDVGINLTGVEWYLNQRVARIDITNKELRPQYMYYYLVYSGFTEAVRNLSTGSAQPNVSTKNIESLTLPLPPIEFQESIIMRLNALQIQLSSLENLGKQAEDNARFILDSYLNTA